LNIYRIFVATKLFLKETIVCNEIIFTFEKRVLKVWEFHCNQQHL